TSPSLGITSPALTMHSSPTWSWLLGTSSTVPSGRRRRASVSDRVLRSVAACALPRPSAIASAQFAKSTVNHRNAATRPANTFSFVVDLPMSRKKMIVVNTLPTSTTNITGLRAWLRGFNFLKLSTIAPRTIVGSNNDFVGSGCRSRALLPMGRARWRGGRARICMRLPREKRRGRDGGTGRKGREEGEPRDDQGHADHEAAEQGRGRGEGARRCGRRLLLGERPSDSEDGDHQH